MGFVGTKYSTSKNNYNYILILFLFNFIYFIYLIFRHKKVMELEIKKYVNLQLLKIFGNIGHLFLDQGNYFNLLHILYFNLFLIVKYFMMVKLKKKLKVELLVDFVYLKKELDLNGKIL